MFILSLKVESELEKSTFDQVFEILDDCFDIQGVISITADGDEIETIANVIETDNGVTYEFDCEDRASLDVGNTLMAQLDKIISGDFELDAPVIN